MFKEINIGTRLYDSKILTLTDNENLQIKLVGKTYPNVDYYFKARNGSKFFQIKFVDNFIEIDRKDLFYGILNAKIVAMQKDKILKEIEVEDLILQEVSKNIEVIPQIEQIKAEFQTIKAENEELKRKVEEFTEMCKKTKELVIELNGITGKVGV